MQPKRGRPQEADAGQIATVAIALFEKKGFDAVSMDDVARRARVSRSTLFRLYPSKADLVWHEAAPIVGLARARLDELETLGDVLETVIVPAVRLVDDATLAPLARRRLRLIGSTPELSSHRTLHEIQRVLGEAFSRLGAPHASLMARTVVATAFGAILWWADDASGLTAEAAVRAAFGVLRRQDAATKV